jgi:ComF family protein
VPRRCGCRHWSLCAGLRKINHILWSGLNSLVGLFFPTICRLCQKPVDDISVGVVCNSCWSQIRTISQPYCKRCGYAFPSKIIEPEEALCGACRRGLYDFDFARAYGPFREPLKEMVHQFKYRSHPSLARPLAHRLAALYMAHQEQLSANLIIPVPLHRVREKERGFNQASELAKHLARLTGIDVERYWLLRSRPTKVQAGLSRRERRLNVRGAFGVSGRARFGGKSILLVDDVFTTGATLNECARILKQKGARQVSALTVARVIRE